MRIRSLIMSQKKHDVRPAALDHHCLNSDTSQAGEGVARQKSRLSYLHPRSDFCEYIVIAFNKDPSSYMMHARGAVSEPT